MIEVDVRGMSCPIPVVKTKKAIEQNPGETILVLLNNAVSKENVARFAGNKGYTAQEETDGEEIKLSLTPIK